MNIGTDVLSTRGLIRASVLVGGRKQSLYRRSDGRVFVASQPGQAYTLGVQVIGSGRVEVLCAIDGWNVLKDEPGDAHRNHGMVFEGHSLGGFTGRPIGNTETHGFMFRDVTTQAGDNPPNIGAIGFAVYQEVPYPSDYRISLLGADFEDVLAYPLIQGEATRTGVGGLRENRDFLQRADEPDILVIGYDRPEVLERRGILAPPDPDPFPGIGYDQHPVH